LLLSLTTKYQPNQKIRFEDKESFEERKDKKRKKERKKGLMKDESGCKEIK
jgi:hypothetical protein